MTKVTQFEVVPLDEVMRIAVPIGDPEPGEILPAPDQIDQQLESAVDAPESSQA